jgi:flavin reductase (DIM6/NTAB) family NADH-FMN oxidoreductase RutF
LASGDFHQGDFNAMTVAWGSLGTMWHRPFAQVVVRPTRYTFELMERYPSFTLTAFPEAYRSDLQMLGSVSGRDRDKIGESNLTPVAASIVAAPSFAEAELVLECRKVYSDDMRPGRILDAKVHELYSIQDYHRIYFGEIVAACAVDSFVEK